MKNSSLRNNKQHLKILRIIKYIMDKKRELITIVGVVFLVGVVVFGGIAGNKIISENRYVGDKTTSLYYDLKKCDISNIPRENLISFKNLEEAKKYEPAECSL